MKKFLLLLFLSFSFFSKGQTNVYHPFPEDSAKWCASICGNMGNGLNEATYELSGKVLINGNWYSRMLYYERSCYGVGQCYCGLIYGADTATYYIRQDIAQKKVWLHVDSTNTDTIFLDFDLNVGDTIDGRKAYWAGEFSFVGIVSSIDSVLIGTQYRTRFEYEDQTYPNYLIEGIGPDHGFFYDANIGYDHIQTLGIFLQNNHVYYPNYSSATVDMNQYCHDFTTRIEEQNQIAFSISPNPTHNILNIECTLPSAELKIYDMTGREVMEEKIHSQLSTFNFQLSGGVYFLRVSDGEKTAVQKLIIE